jgi:acyl-CoA synthetase (AMP-forming)/AMP-acid ligase II
MLSAQHVSELFNTSASQSGSLAAIISKNKSITFLELQKKVWQKAASLRKSGIVPGDRVLVFIPMSIELYTTVLAIFQVGATAVFLDQWSDRQRLKMSCRIADCRAITGSQKLRFLRPFVSVLREIPIFISGKMVHAEDVFTELLHPPDNTALITFTTGSTGVPKASVRTHHHLLEQFKALGGILSHKSGTTDLPTLPIVLLINLGMGVTSVLPDWNPSKPQNLIPQNIFRQINNHKVQSITASPFFIRQLALSGGHPGIERIVTGGAPVFPCEAQEIREKFQNARCTVVYGSTEAEPVSSISFDELVDTVATEGLCTGDIHKDTQLKIIPLHYPPGAYHNLPEHNQKEIGEIIVAGPHVLEHYFRNKDAETQNKLHIEGKIWHRTGDSGFIKENKLWLTGRCSQLIEANGRLISPFVIEGRLQAKGITGTMLLAGGEPTLIVEGSEEKLKERVPDMGFCVRYVDLIPRDKRHFSKIDYGRLGEMLKM